MKNLKEKRKTRHIRVRNKISGSALMPRLVVHRSNKHIYAQLLDDHAQKTIYGLSDAKVKVENDNDVSSGKIKMAHLVGKMLAQKAITKKINKVVFDRAGYKYHGRVKALAQGAREGGLKF